MNFNNMKKIATDGKTSTFASPEGHSIKVLHSALPALQRKQLEKMPIYKADGGDWEGSTEVAPEQTQAPADDTSGASGSWGDESDNTSAPQQTSDQSQNMPTQAQTQDMQQPKYSMDFGQNLQGAAQSMQNIGQNESNLAKQQQSLLEGQAIQMTKINDAAQKFQQDNLTHRQTTLDDMMKGHIDPNAYMKGLGTGGKIASAIGLFLGGMSTPFTHQGNPALDFINKQIDRNIEAQKADFGNQRTLLEANTQLFHDSVLGENQTRMNLNDLTAVQMKQAAAKIGTKQAIDQANLGIKKLMMDNSGLMWQNSMRQAVMQQGGAAPLSAKIQYMLPQAQQQEAQKQAGEYDSLVRAHTQANDILDNMEKEQTAGNLWNPQSYDRMNQYKAALIKTILETSPSKRLNEEALTKQVEPFFAGTTHSQETLDAARRGVNNLIDSSAGPMNILTDNKFIPPPGQNPMLKMSGEDRSLLKASASNPQDPRSKKFLQQLRKKYAF